METAATAVWGDDNVSGEDDGLCKVHFTFLFSRLPRAKTRRRKVFLFSLRLCASFFFRLSTRNPHTLNRKGANF